MKEVLDSRFFTVLFYERDNALREAAREKLRHLRREKRGVLPAIVIAEIVSILCREGGRDLARAHLRAMETYGLEITPVDSGIAGDAGLLRCTHRDLPMADAIVATIALNVDGRVVSDDEHFSRIPGLRVAWIS